MPRSLHCALPSGVLRLAPGEMLRIERGRGWRLYCVRGSLLWSQQGSLADEVLPTGASLDLGQGRAMLFEACGEVTLRLEPAGASTAPLLPMRLGLRLWGC